MFKIEKHVPPPPKFRRRRGMYPFPEMDVGDSFHVADEVSFDRARNAASRYGGQTGKKFVSRIDLDRERGGRIWRTA